jgi:hypothetical protein
MAGNHTQHEPNACSGIAEIEVGSGFLEPADTAAEHLPNARILADRAPEGLQGLGRIEHILAFEQPGDARAAGREGAQHQRPV